MSTRTALLLIDVQKGFKEPCWGERNNPMAEENISLLLNNFRQTKQSIFHIQHLSREKFSPLQPGQVGVEFMEGFEPKFDEILIQKKVNSAFMATPLENELRFKEITTLVMAGFTTDHCISSSARMAANLGFKVQLVTDATVAFARQGPILYPPELVHQVSLASLNREFASLVNTVQLAKHWL